MKKILIALFLIVPFLLTACKSNPQAQVTQPKYIINTKNGRIIKAYLVFRDYLNSEKSWNNYKKMVLGAFPEMQAAHNKQISWGSIDSAKFREEVSNYKMEDWEKYFTRYDDKTLNYLCDSLLEKENNVLKPVKNIPVDLCLFIPYGGCWIEAGEKSNVIYISLLIDPADIEKIMVHEYAHNLHMQRRPEEPYTFKREIVSEGMAVYLTTLTLNRPDLKNAIPFMSDSSLNWCIKNENLIKDSLRVDLNDTTFTSMLKYIADGVVATPPKGFVEKTAFFAGYKVIEACIKKGMKLEDICALNSNEVIKTSGYFN